VDWRTECIAVVPCLNEAAAIGPVVTALPGYVSAVLVVDDGSIDGTQEVARDAGAEVLRLESTRGKGSALRAGWQAARQRGFTWALTLDGDGQHAPADTPKFFNCAEQTSAALIVGNRMSDSVRMPWTRLATNRWMSRRISSLAGRPLPDSQCGFRLIRLDLLAGLPITAEHFEIESDTLLAFVRAGHRVEFVPIQAIYKQEQSKIHLWCDLGRWLRWWWRVTRHRIE
jgi:glycosyltransferase involved in cell wall biosynthesis